MKETPQPTASPSVIDMHLNPRNLAMAFLLFAGGATGTGAFELARSDSVPPSLAADVKELKEATLALTLSIAEMRGALSTWRADVARITTDVTDHEQRIRSLEARPLKPH